MVNDVASSRKKGFISLLWNLNVRTWNFQLRNFIESSHPLLLTEEDGPWKRDSFYGGHITYFVKNPFKSVLQMVLLNVTG